MKLAPKNIGGPWKAWWPGIIVDNADPLKAGRVRVRVGAVYGAEDEGEFIPDDQLPWAIPCFLAAHQGSGCAWVPPVGAVVSVLFWGGDHEVPMWAGGYYTEGEPPSEFISAYEEGGAPKTRVVKLENGHIFEMRYKSGESEIHIDTEKGLKLRLVDAPGGLKIEATTPAGYTFALDEATTRVLLKTPTQTFEMLEPNTTITTLGKLDITAAVLSTWNITALVLAAAATLTLTALGVLTFTGAGVVLATSAGAIALGSVAGAKQALVMANYLVSIYNLHGHAETGGTTGPPNLLAVLGTHATTNVVGD